MKILQICQKPNNTVSNFDLFEETVRAYTEQGHAVDLCFLEGQTDVQALEQRTGAKVVELALGKKDFRGMGSNALKALYRLARANDYDMIVTHRYKPSYLLMVLSPFLACKRFVAVYHGMYQLNRFGRRLLAKMAINEKWRVVAVSNAVENDLVESGVPRERCRVIYNAIDQDGMRAALPGRDEARAALGIAPQLKVIGTIGRITGIKGHVHLLDAFHRLAGEDENLFLLIIGGGELEENINARVAEYGLGGRVKITGTLPNAYKLLPAMDCFVMSSLSEGLPIAMLEAIAAGLPVAGTDAGGIPELIPSPAFIAPPGNGEALAAVIRRLLALDAADKCAYQEALQQEILTKFSLQNYKNGFLELLPPA